MVDQRIQPNQEPTRSGITSSPVGRLLTAHQGQTLDVLLNTQANNSRMLLVTDQQVLTHTLPKSLVTQLPLNQSLLLQVIPQLHPHHLTLQLSTPDAAMMISQNGNGQPLSQPFDFI